MCSFSKIAKSARSLHPTVQAVSHILSLFLRYNLTALWSDWLQLGWHSGSEHYCIGQNIAGQCSFALLMFYKRLQPHTVSLYDTMKRWLYTKVCMNVSNFVVFIRASSSTNLFWSWDSSSQVLFIKITTKIAALYVSVLCVFALIVYKMI